MQSTSRCLGESRETAAAEEATRGVANDPDSRPLNPSSSSTDPQPERSERDTSADAANTPDQMMWTAHPLESASDENVLKKASVARNVLHIRGESELKLDVNEEAWPNADLAIRSGYEGALIDGLPADKVKAGDEREIRQMKDLQLYSWIKETDVPHDKSILLTGWARRKKGSEVRSRCVLKDFATTVRDNVFSPTPSPLSVRGLLLYAAWYDLRVETGDLACAFMQTVSSSETYARPPKGQEREGWIWKLHGAMNGMKRRTVTLQNSWPVYSRNTWASNAESWNVVYLFTNRTNHEWCHMLTILSFVPNLRRSRNSGHRSRGGL